MTNYNSGRPEPEEGGKGEKKPRAAGEKAEKVGGLRGEKAGKEKHPNDESVAAFCSLPCVWGMGQLKRTPCSVCFGGALMLPQTH